MSPKDPNNVRRGRLSKARGKAMEREWAAAFGTERRTDARGARQSDLRLGDLDIEVKSRIGMKGLEALMEEAIVKAERGQFPVLGLTLRRPAGNKHYVIMERQDFLDLRDAIWDKARWG